MKPIGRLLTLIVIVSAICILPTQPVQAGKQLQAAVFTCGPHMLTYLAKERTGEDMGDGVRCVLINNNIPARDSSRIPKLVWYGEGWWTNSSGWYRHVGVAFTQRGKRTLL